MCNATHCHSSLALRTTERSCTSPPASGLPFPGLNRLLATAFLPFAITAAAQQAEVTRYDVADGLPQSMVNHVLQDSDGFIWLGTGDGLARFDGQRFVVYKHDPQDSTTLSHNNIWGLAERDEHSLWVGTRSGLDVLDRRTGRVRHHPTGLPSKEDGCWTVLGTTTDEQVWYSPLNGHLLRIGPHGQRLQRLTHAASYATHLDASSGTISQYLSHDSLLTIHAEGEETVAQLPKSKQERITDLVKIGDRWLMLSDQSAWLWSPQLGRLPLPPATQAWMDHPSVKKRGAIADDGSIWVGGSGQGVVVLDTALHIVRSYPLLPPTERPLDITSITFDRQGNIWVGTDGKGVFKIAPQRIKFGRCMPGQGLPWEPPSWFVRGFAPWDAHQVLVNLYQGGFAVFDERTNILLPLELPPATRQLIQEADLFGPSADLRGTLWLRDPTRVSALVMGSGRSLFPDGWIARNALACNKDGDMVTLDKRGLWAMRYGTEGIRAEALPSTRLSHWMDSMGMVPNRMAFDAQDRLFLCQSVLPITVWKDDRRIAAGPFHDDLRFTSIQPDDSVDLWMTTNDGLYLLAGSDLSVKRHWTTHDGLPDQFLYGMLPAGDGTWWISSNSGLSHFDPEAETFTNYGVADGVQSSEYNSNAFYRSRSGRLYFGGVNGFNHFLPGDVGTDPDTAHVLIVGLAVQDSIVDLAVLGNAPGVVLPHGRNHLRIDLAVLEFSAPEHNRYRYRVTGYSEWQEHEVIRPISLTNMPAGAYTLEVVGINGDGLASTPRTLLSISVPLPFTSSPGFYVVLGMLFIGAAGGIGFLVYRQRMERRHERIAQEMKELRIRARIAQDLHDDLGSGLARITALSRTAERNIVKGDDVRIPVGKLTTLSQELMHDLRDVVWVNDPCGGELADLLLRIRDHALDLFEGTNTICTVHYPRPLPERNIGPTAKRDLYLIAKEAAHNALKYSGASAFDLVFHIDVEGFRMELRDNGRGLNDGAKTQGHGLRNMQDRAVEIGCTLVAGKHDQGGFQLVLAGPVASLDL